MDHRILSFPVVRGLPVIPGVQWITPGPVLSLFGEIVAAPPSAHSNHWCRRIIGMAIPIDRVPGTYRVWAEPADWPMIDPSGVGLSQADYLAAGGRDNLTYWEITGTTSDPITGETVEVTRVVAMPVVPAEDATPARPWIVGDITATSAVPGLPAIVNGGYGMKAALTAAAAAPLGGGEKVVIR